MKRKADNSEPDVKKKIICRTNKNVESLYNKSFYSVNEVIKTNNYLDFSPALELYDDIILIKGFKDLFRQIDESCQIILPSQFILWLRATTEGLSQHHLQDLTELIMLLLNRNVYSIQHNKISHRFLQNLMDVFTKGEIDLKLLLYKEILNQVQRFSLTYIHAKWIYRMGYVSVNCENRDAQMMGISFLSAVASTIPICLQIVKKSTLIVKEIIDNEIHEKEKSLSFQISMNFLLTLTSDIYCLKHYPLKEHLPYLIDCFLNNYKSLDSFIIEKLLISICSISAVLNSYDLSQYKSHLCEFFLLEIRLKMENPFLSSYKELCSKLRKTYQQIMITNKLVFSQYEYPFIAKNWSRLEVIVILYMNELKNTKYIVEHISDYCLNCQIENNVDYFNMSEIFLLFLDLFHDYLKIIKEPELLSQEDFVNILIGYAPDKYLKQHYEICQGIQVPNDSLRSLSPRNRSNEFNTVLIRSIYSVCAKLFKRCKHFLNSNDYAQRLQCLKILRVFSEMYIFYLVIDFDIITSVMTIIRSYYTDDIKEEEKLQSKETFFNLLTLLYNMVSNPCIAATKCGSENGSLYDSSLTEFLLTMMPDILCRNWKDLRAVFIKNPLIFTTGITWILKHQIKSNNQQKEKIQIREYFDKLRGFIKRYQDSKHKHICSLLNKLATTNLTILALHCYKFELTTDKKEQFYDNIFYIKYWKFDSFSVDPLDVIIKNVFRDVPYLYWSNSIDAINMWGNLINQTIKCIREQPFSQTLHLSLDNFINQIVEFVSHNYSEDSLIDSLFYISESLNKSEGYQFVPVQIMIILRVLLRNKRMLDEQSCLFLQHALFILREIKKKQKFTWMHLELFCDMFKYIPPQTNLLTGKDYNKPVCNNIDFWDLTTEELCNYDEVFIVYDKVKETDVRLEERIFVNFRKLSRYSGFFEAFLRFSIGSNNSVECKDRVNVINLKMNQLHSVVLRQFNVTPEMTVTAIKLLLSSMQDDVTEWNIGHCCTSDSEKLIAVCLVLSNYFIIHGSPLQTLYQVAIKYCQQMNNHINFAKVAAMSGAAQVYVFLLDTYAKQYFNKNTFDSRDELFSLLKVPFKIYESFQNGDSCIHGIINCLDNWLTKFSF